MAARNRSSGQRAGWATFGARAARWLRDAPAPRVLLVSADAPDRDLPRALVAAGLFPQLVRSAEQIPVALAGGNVIAVLLGVSSAVDLCGIARVVASAGTLPVVVLTRERDPATAQAIRRAGAAEVLAEDERDARADVLRHFQPSAAAAPVLPEEPPLPLAAALASISVVLGAVVLVGWWVGLRDVARLVPGLVAMKANTPR